MTGEVEQVGRRVAESRALAWAARLGFAARGLMYVLIGAIAVQVAFGERGQADRGGALGKLAHTRGGPVLLGVLAVGFAGIALWRFSEAAVGVRGGGGGHQGGERITSAARGVLYAVFCVSTAQLVLGSSASATANSNGQSQELTARVMGHAGGRLLIGVAGVALAGVGVFLAREAWTRAFLDHLDFQGAPRAAAVVEKLGVIGGLARAAIFVLAGILLVDAAIRFDPADAEGIDGTLRTFTRTPLGPALLVVVALGLVTFGVFSWCEARWRRI